MTRKPSGVSESQVLRKPENPSEPGKGLNSRKISEPDA